MPINYNNGKIYKIINNNNEIIYIGSTAQEKLCDRFKTHKHRGNGNKIVLLELCPCNSKQELFMMEQEYIELHDNLLNQVRAFNSEEYTKEYYKKYHIEYREKHKNKISEKLKIYYEENKNKISEQHKKWYEENKNKIKLHRETNKDKIKEYNKEYHEINRDKILEYKKAYREKFKDDLSEKGKIKVICECGCEIRKGKIVRHKKTKKHIKLMESK